MNINYSLEFLSSVVSNSQLTNTILSTFCLFFLNCCVFINSKFFSTVIFFKLISINLLIFVIYYNYHVLITQGYQYFHSDRVPAKWHYITHRKAIIGYVLWKLNLGLPREKS